MTTTTNGKCNICGIELGKTAMKNHILKKHENEDGEECCLLKCECDNPAEYIDVERIYDSNNPFYCASCTEVDEYGDYDMLLPVTNSPRMGVYGYEGELDVFIENH